MLSSQHLTMILVGTIERLVLWRNPHQRDVVLTPDADLNTESFDGYGSACVLTGQSQYSLTVTGRGRLQ